ncbi:MAG: DEAD/DEAH box helicase [Propionibacteriaceae bacterium]|nr:DEAD/DEAH box helicase [Propionibacteriaceae bacterium]
MRASEPLVFSAMDLAYPDIRSARHAPEPLWRRQVSQLLPPPSVSPAPVGGATLDKLGLQIRVDGMTATSGVSSHTSSQPPSLSIRPVLQDAKGKWKSDFRLTWRGRVAYSPINLDPRAEQWLHDLAGLDAEIARYGYWSGDTRWQRLDGFAEAGLWPLLATAEEAGIPLVGPTAADEVCLAGSTSLNLNLARTQDGGLALTRALLVDERPTRPTLMGAIGDSGLFCVEADGEARRITLGPARPRLSSIHLTLLAVGVIEVPEGQIPDFMDTYYPALRRHLTVTSLDHSVDLPQPPRPVLVGRVTADSVYKVGVAWGWRYGGVTHPFQADGFSVAYRDEPAEQRITALVEETIRALSEFSSYRLRGTQVFDARGGFEARAFIDHIVPWLQDLPDVEILVPEDLPAYEDVEEAPVIAVWADDAGDADWFDLGLEIRAGDRVVPFQDLFVALATGQTRMLLDDGAVVPIDAPQFERLKELIDEARALADRPSQALGISRYQAGLWSDLADLATEVRVSDQWRAQVVDLLALVDADTAGESGGPVRPVETPAGLTTVLRPYQKRAYEWLTFLDAHGLGGILADDMGLGKTLEVLAFILGVVERRPPAAQGTTHAPFLVVAPASVVGNWKDEAAHHAPGLRVLALRETMKKAGVSMDDIRGTVDVVVTSYAIFRMEVDELSTLDWAGLILDEAQFVKNPRTTGNELARTFPARFKLAVTGTPMENDVMELWALLSIVAPGFAGPARRFRQVYASPISKAATAQQRRRLMAAHPRSHPDEEMDHAIDEGRIRLAQLRRRLRPLLLRRTKELVTPDLPSRVENQVEVDLAPRHRAVYDTYLQRERQRVLGLLDDLDKNRFAVLRSLTILRRLALDASLIDEAKYAGVPSAKLDTLMEQVGEVVASGHRALIFSQFTTFLAKVVERLEKAGIDFAYLDGHTTRRDRVIQRFRTQDVPVFCLSLKAGGFGLTLTEADYVFLLDPWWNPATEQQAIDRTHRIGQTRAVMVQRLVSTGTIEEKVMALQARKKEVFNSVLADDAGEASFASALTADDIRSLLDD